MSNLMPVDLYSMSADEGFCLSESEMEVGNHFKKYAFHSPFAASLRVVWLDYRKKCLLYGHTREDKKPKFIELSKIRKIFFGKFTNAFLGRPSMHALNSKCFSIVTQERSLDLEAKSERFRSSFVRALLRAIFPEHKNSEAVDPPMLILREPLEVVQRQAEMEISRYLNSKIHKLQEVYQDLKSRVDLNPDHIFQLQEMLHLKRCLPRLVQENEILLAREQQLVKALEINRAELKSLTQAQSKYKLMVSSLRWELDQKDIRARDNRHLSLRRSQHGHHCSDLLLKVSSSRLRLEGCAHTISLLVPRDRLSVRGRQKEPRSSWQVQQQILINTGVKSVEFILPSWLAGTKKSFFGDNYSFGIHIKTSSDSNEVSAPDAVFSVHDILGQLDHQREEQAKAERTDKAIQSVVMQDKGIEVHAYRAAAV